MNTLFIGKNFVELPSVDSTNDFLAWLLESRPAEGTVVFSSNQLAGKGQQGNVWRTEPGANIACSILLYPHFLPPAKVFLLNKAIAVALVDAIQAFLPEEKVQLKWPNDLLVNRHKLSGTLIETHMTAALLSTAIVGIGINVNQVKFGEGYGKPTSLALATGKSYHLQEVLDTLLEKVEARYLALRAGRHDAIEQDYLHAMYGYQEEIRMVIDGALHTAMPVGVDSHGRLAVQVDGRLRYFGIQEIAFHL